jgi:hypothetical protein
MRRISHLIGILAFLHFMCTEKLCSLCRKKDRVPSIYVKMLNGMVYQVSINNLLQFHIRWAQNS